MTLNNANYKLFLIIPVLLAGMILFDWQKSRPPTNLTDTPAPKKFLVITEATIPAPITASRLYQAINKKTEQKINNCRPRSGIISHHDLASELIADFFWQLSQVSQPKTFIILAPNHSDVALAPAISGHVQWQTAWGKVTNNYPILNALEKSGQIAFDQENFSKEHAIGVLTPFIKHYFPKATIVPIILTSKKSLEGSNDLAREITKHLDQETFLIASLDFSHYLPSDRTQDKDQITLQLIKNKNFVAITQLNSDYLDSPPTLNTLLKINELIGADNLEILDHTESGQIINQPQISSTSYFSLFFCE